jgi:uncharacterized zinc-type alcohol dehydrogenase-like protein
MSKWGCDVTAISSSSDKEEQAREFGARHFINAGDTNGLKNAANSFEFMLSAVSGDLPWDDYVGTLKPQGKLCIVGGAKKPISVNMLSLLLREKVIAGGIPGSPVETTQMLAFAARHGIKPMVETFPMSQISQALEHVRQGKPRFRAVLVA